MTPCEAKTLKLHLDEAITDNYLTLAGLRTHQDMDFVRRQQLKVPDIHAIFLYLYDGISLSSFRACRELTTEV